MEHHGRRNIESYRLAIKTLGQFVRITLAGFRRRCRGSQI